MAMKPSNVVNQLRDKLVQSPVIDFSAATADGTAGPLFVDPEHKWQVMSVRMLAVVDYVASQATNVNVGTFVNPNNIVADQSLGDVLISGGELGPELDLEEDKRVLVAGEPLVAGHTQAAGQTGTGILVMRLRMMDQQPFSTKRPQDARASA